MAERKFDYDNVKTVYDGMKTINGKIKDLLTESDTEVESRVSVVDEALYGDLGSQMLLNWENISSNFPNFIDNFENWAALVAKASGNYGQFEKDVAGLKEANPYGATSGGIKASYVSTSSYNNSLTAEQIEALDAQRFIYEETSPEYIDTGMVHQAKVTKAWNIVTDVFNVIGLVSTGTALAKYGKAVWVAKHPKPVAATPAAATPGTSTPAAATPAASTSAASTPGASTPAASTPGASTPAAATPATSTPAASTPGTSTPITIKSGSPIPGTTEVNPSASKPFNGIEIAAKGPTPPTGGTSPSAVKPLVGEVVQNSDDLLRQRYTIGSDGVYYPPSSQMGAPTATNSAFIDATKGEMFKYHAGYPFRQAARTVTNGYDTVKNGLVNGAKTVQTKVTPLINSAGKGIQSGYNAAKGYATTAGVNNPTYIATVGVPSLMDGINNLEHDKLNNEMNGSNDL